MENEFKFVGPKKLDKKTLRPKRPWSVFARKAVSGLRGNWKKLQTNWKHWKIFQETLKKTSPWTALRAETWGLAKPRLLCEQWYAQ